MKKKLLKGVIVGAIIIVAFVLQCILSKENNHIIVTPNFLLIVACIFGFMRGYNYGAVVGLICGLLVDVMFGDVIGLYALLYIYVGFISGLFKKWFYSDKVFMPMIVIAINDFLFNLGVYAFRFLLRNKRDFSFYFEKIILPEIVISVFVILITYKLFYMLNERVLTDKEESMLSFDK